LCGQTDTGRVRDHNEDTIAYDADIGLLVLADGMGGYNAGEVRVALPSRRLSAWSRMRWSARPAHHDSTAGLTRASIILRDAILRANKIIFQTARTQPQCEGMGPPWWERCSSTTGVHRHVGDSRLYRLRGSALEQVTMDHSLLQELVDRGF